jgi:hypothetical protein
VAAGRRASALGGETGEAYRRWKGTALSGVLAGEAGLGKAREYFERAQAVEMSGGLAAHVADLARFDAAASRR